MKTGTSVGDVLQMLKGTRTCEDPSAVTGLPAGDPNRCVNGDVLPGADRASEVVGAVGRDALAVAEGPDPAETEAIEYFRDLAEFVVVHERRFGPFVRYKSGSRRADGLLLTDT